jgi:hypothetical protein
LVITVAGAQRSCACCRALTWQTRGASLYASPEWHVYATRPVFVPPLYVQSDS